jgi:hypothetical protein
LKKLKFDKPTIDDLPEKLKSKLSEEEQEKALRDIEQFATLLIQIALDNE